MGPQFSGRSMEKQRLFVVSQDAVFFEQLQATVERLGQKLPLDFSVEYQLCKASEPDMVMSDAADVTCCIIDTCQLKKSTLEKLWHSLSENFRLPTALLVETLEEKKEVPNSVRVQCIETFEKRGLSDGLLVQFLRRVAREAALRKDLLSDIGLNRLVSDFSAACLKSLQHDDRTLLEEGLSQISKFHHLQELAIYQFEKPKSQLMGSSLAFDNSEARHGLETWTTSDLPWLAEHIVAGKPLVVNNISSLPREAEKEKWEWAQRGLQSVILFPIVENSTTIGDLFATSSQKSFADSPQVLDSLKRLATPVKHYLLAHQARKSREEKIAELKSEAMAIEERYHCILESINMGLMMSDEEGRFVYTNNHSAKMLGREVGELIGRRAADIFYPPELRDKNPTLKREFEKHHSMMRSRFKERMRGQAENYRDKVFLPNGDVRTLRVHAGPLRMADGSIIGSVRLDYDITERARLEEELMQSYKYLRFRAVSRLLTRELALLSTLISLRLDLLERKKVDSHDLSEIFDTICFHLHHLCLLIEGRKANPELIDLNRFVSEIEFLMSSQLPENSQVQMLLEENLPKLKIDPGHLQQIVFSQLFTQREGLANGEDLQIRSHFHNVSEDRVVYTDRVEPGTYVSLTIGDTRVGLAEIAESLELKAEETVDEEQLYGLASLAGVVRDYGGSISAYFHEGKRKSITVYFPVDVEQGQERLPQPFPSSFEGQALVIGETSEFGFIQTLATQIESFGFGVSIHRQYERIDAALRNQELKLLVAEEYLMVRDGYKLYKFVREIRPDLRMLLLNDSLKAFQEDGRFPRSEVEYLDIPFTSHSLHSKIACLMEELNLPAETRVHA